MNLKISGNKYTNINLLALNYLSNGIPVGRGALSRSPTPGKLQLMFSKNFMIIIITALIILRRVSIYYNFYKAKESLYGKTVNYFNNQCY